MEKTASGYLSNACLIKKIFGKQVRLSAALDDIKKEFGAPCTQNYNAALESLKVLCAAHDCARVLEALREDLGI